MKQRKRAKLHPQNKKIQKSIDKREKSVYNVMVADPMQPAECDEYTEKYSRGRRGAPAKGVGRLYRRESSNLSFSAIQVHNSDVVGLFLLNKDQCFLFLTSLTKNDNNTVLVPP